MSNQTRTTLVDSSDPAEIAELLSDRINAHGDGLSADWDFDGYTATVAVLNCEARIGRIIVDSDGDIEASVSRRRGLVFGLTGLR